MNSVHPDCPSFIKEDRHQFSIYCKDLARELGVSYSNDTQWGNNQSKPSKLSQAQLNVFCERMKTAAALDIEGSIYG